MSQFNKIILEGNLVKDPEVFGDEKKVTRFTIGNNSGFGDHVVTSFIDCVAFGKTGETIAQHFTKGKPIQVEGQLEQTSWEKDGVKRYGYQIKLQNFVFRGSPIKEEEPKY